VDTARKRIALSIKQTETPPAKNQQRSRPGGQLNNSNNKPAAAPTMNDALAALKQKFGK
jgi:protein Tex